MRHGLATIPGIMFGTIWCAVILTLLRNSRLEWLAILLFLLVVGPICGTVMQKRIGGRGILGGTAAGAISFVALGMIYLSGYSGFEHLTMQTMGPVWVLVFFAYWGALAGFAVGVLTWGLAPGTGPPRKP